MKAIDLIRKTRLYAKDMNATTYSDYEIYNAINDAMRELAEVSSQASGWMFKGSSSISMSNNKAVLPEGFVSVSKVFDPDKNEMLNVHNDTPGEGEFSIMGNEIYSTTTPITVWYYSIPSIIEDEDDDIDLSDGMLVPIATIAAMSLKGDASSGHTYAQYYVSGGSSNNTNAGSSK